MLVNHIKSETQKTEEPTPLRKTFSFSLSQVSRLSVVVNTGGGRN